VFSRFFNLLNRILCIKNVPYAMILKQHS
jgi:hypothetical protein